MRAKGPFKVHKYQSMGWTDICIRSVAVPNQPRVLTVHDGWHDVRATAGFFAAAEEMYEALRGVEPLSQHVAPAMEALLQGKAAPDQIAQVVDAVRRAFVAVTQALRAADTPVENPPPEPQISDPSYTQLINALGEIRRVVGGDKLALVGTPSEAQEMMDTINQVVAILNSLTPKWLASPERIELDDPVN